MNKPTFLGANTTMYPTKHALTAAAQSIWLIRHSRAMVKLINSVNCLRFPRGEQLKQIAACGHLHSSHSGCKVHELRNAATSLGDSESDLPFVQIDARSEPHGPPSWHVPCSRCSLGARIRRFPWLLHVPACKHNHDLETCGDLCEHQQARQRLPVQST